MLLESPDLVSLRKRRFLDMLILVHKSFQAATPAYISALFTPRTNINGLRGVNKLQLLRVNTTSYRKTSFKLWNMLNDDLRTTTNITYFSNNCLEFVTS